jgi:hypothetical protein
MATAPAAVVAMQPSATKERRNWSVRFDDAAGNAHLEVRLERKKTGWKTYMIHTTGEGKQRVQSRGATEKHGDERSARAAFDRAVAAALQAKWARTPRTFNAKPDAFTLTILLKPSKK